jgi:hypothetical protein
MLSLFFICLRRFAKRVEQAVEPCIRKKPSLAAFTVC